jgi:hypothetical protein
VKRAAQSLHVFVTEAKDVRKLVQVAARGQPISGRALAPTGTRLARKMAHDGAPVLARRYCRVRLRDASAAHVAVAGSARERRISQVATRTSKRGIDVPEFLRAYGDALRQNPDGGFLGFVVLLVVVLLVVAVIAIGALVQATGRVLKRLRERRYQSAFHVTLPGDRHASR